MIPTHKYNCVKQSKLLSSSCKLVIYIYFSYVPAMSAEKIWEI